MRGSRYVTAAALLLGSAKQPFSGIGPLIEHFDGTKWSIVATPIAFGHLYGISAVTSNDVWAVGTASEAASSHALILHWDGASWSEDPLDQAGCERGMTLAGVDATGRKPLAVGSCLPVKGAARPVILSRGAHRWTEDSTEGLDIKNVDLVSVSWTGNTAWASGGTRLDHGRTLRLQDGAWGLVDVPPHMGIQTGFAGPSGSDVWAVGWKPFDWKSMHWDGSAWTPVKETGTGWLEEVTLTADGTPWAVGATYKGPLSVIQRYDGSL